MNSVTLVQSNVDALPPPTPEPATLAQLPAVQISSVLPSPPPRRLNAPVRKRLLKSLSHDLAKEPATWLVDSVISRWKSYRERLDECRDKPDAESIHELRVAIRRLTSQLFLVGQIFPARRSEKVRRILKRQLESLGNLRDTQVQQIIFRKQVTRFPELVDLVARLERRECSLVSRASRTIVRFKTKKVESLVHYITKLLQRQLENPAVRREIVSSAVQTANAAFAEVTGRWRVIDRSDLRTIHRTRVAFKRFRYIVEALPPEISGLNKRQLRALAWYQRKMGNIQDLEVVRGGVDEFLQRHESARPLLRPFCKYLRERRTRALWSFRKSANELFAFWQLPPHGDRRIVGHLRTIANSGKVEQLLKANI